MPSYCAVNLVMQSYFFICLIGVASKLDAIHANISALGADDPLSRAKDELGFDQALKDHTYIIAVWRRRESCEEPLSQIDGWGKIYKSNFEKNKAVCQSLGLF